MKIDNLDKAHAFWSVADNGSLLQSVSTGGPLMFTSKADATWTARTRSGKPVKVYVLVEDDD